MRLLETKQTRRGTDAFRFFRKGFPPLFRALQVVVFCRNAVLQVSANACRLTNVGKTHVLHRADNLQQQSNVSGRKKRGILRKSSFCGAGDGCISLSGQSLSGFCFPTVVFHIVRPGRGAGACGKSGATALRRKTVCLRNKRLQSGGFFRFG